MGKVAPRCAAVPIVSEEIGPDGREWTDLSLVPSEVLCTRIALATSRACKTSTLLRNVKSRIHEGNVLLSWWREDREGLGARHLFARGAEAESESEWPHDISTRCRSSQAPRNGVHAPSSRTGSSLSISSTTNGGHTSVSHRPNPAG